MSRVERTENPSERRMSGDRRQAPRLAAPNRRTDASGRTPGKAEGENRDVEEALQRQEE